MYFIFQGKTAILSITTGAVETMFTPDGFMGDINVILWPIQVICKIHRCKIHRCKQTL